VVVLGHGALALKHLNSKAGRQKQIQRDVCEKQLPCTCVASDRVLARSKQRVCTAPAVCTAYASPNRMPSSAQHTTPKKLDRHGGLLVLVGGEHPNIMQYEAQQHTKHTKLS
jgi:hypothetical protein